jgi:uncharacterized membrane protein YgcG
MKFVSRFAALIMGAILLFATGLANAQVDNLVFPAFDVNQSVYVARDLSTPGYQVDVTALPRQLDAAASSLRSSSGRTAHVYEVFVKEPASGIQGDKQGGLAAQTIVNTWSTKAAGRFPADDFVLLVMVRRNDNPNQWYVGARVGSAYAQYITLPQIGQVLGGNIATLRAGNYVDYSVASVNGLVQKIGTTASSVAANSRSAPPQASVPSRAPSIAPAVVVRESPGTAGSSLPWGTILVFLILIGLAVFVFVRLSAASRLRAQLDAALAKTAKQLANLNGCKEYVQANFDGLEKGDKVYAVKSVSATSYAAAIATWAQFFAHVKAVKARQAEIDAKVKAVIPVLNISPLKDALALATTTPVVITGKELSADEITLESGLVRQEQFTFLQLADMMGAEFVTVKSTLTKLRDAVRTSVANSKLIKTGLEEVATAKDSLDAAQVSFSHFQDQYGVLLATVDPLLTRIGVDPLGALDDSWTTKAKVESLKDSITQVLELKKQVAEVEATVDVARQAVVAKRSQTVDFIYASLEQPRYADVLPPTYSLTESGGNPNEALAQASSAVNLMSQALSDGRVVDAAAAKTAALEAAAAVKTILESVALAKAMVERDAPTLKAEFDGEPGFAAIGKAYATQDFLAAAQFVEAFKQFDALAGSYRKVGDALIKARLCVTATTESLFIQAGYAVDEVTAATRAGSMSWSAVSEHIQSAFAALNKVSVAIASDLGVYDAGQTAVNNLRLARERSQSVINDSRVSDAPRQRLAPVDAEIAALEALYKSDTRQAWGYVPGRAKQAAATLDTIVAAAKAEIEQADKYAEHLQNLEGSYSRYAGQTYGRTIRGRVYTPTIGFSTSPYGILAAQHRAAADAYYQSRNWTLMDIELAAMEQQMILANTFMWYSTYDMMYGSGDPWARQYAYDQGYRDGIQFDTYHEYVGTTYGGRQEDWAYVPPAESSWRPSEVPAGASCGGADCGSTNTGNGNQGDDGDASTSSSSSSCGSSSSSDSSSSCGSSSSSCGGSSSSCGGSSSSD